MAMNPWPQVLSTYKIEEVQSTVIFAEKPNAVLKEKVFLNTV